MPRLPNTLLTGLILSTLILSVSATAKNAFETSLSFKEAKKSADLYDHRSPFDKADSKEIALTSVNLRFILAARTLTEKRGAGKAITWALLEGVDDALLQEIADAYYARLSKKLENGGLTVTDRYKESKFYQSLAEDAEKRERTTFDKSWGIASVYTANNAPYIEYPMAAFGAHARLGNEMKFPVGQILLTINFADIVQKVSSHTAAFDNVKTVTAKTHIVPVISVIGPTRAQATPRGDGSYAFFQGKNWGATNISVKEPIYSTLQYAENIDKSTGVPEQLQKVRSNLASDLLGSLFGGALDTGRAGSEFNFTVKVDREKYKAAVLDALEGFDQHLFAMINKTL